jgi:hypothetical protein
MGTTTRLFGILLAIFGLGLLAFFWNASFQWIAPVQAIWLWGGTICMTLGLSLAVSVPLGKNLRGTLILVILSFGWIFLFFLPLPNEWRLWPATLAAFVGVLIYRRYYRKHHPGARP